MCRGELKERGDDTLIWQIFLVMTQSFGFHTPKHTLLPDLLVTESIFGFIKQQYGGGLLRLWQKTAEGSGKCDGRKLWSKNIPLRNKEVTNHWHTLWRKVRWGSQLGHYKLGYRLRRGLDVAKQCGDFWFLIYWSNFISSSISGFFLAQNRSVMSAYAQQ